MNTFAKNRIANGWTYLLMFVLVMNIVYSSNLLIVAVAFFTIGWLALSETKISIKVSLNTINLILMFGLASVVTIISKTVTDDYSLSVVAKSYFVLLYILIFLILDSFRAFRLAALRSIKWMLILFVSIFYLQFIIYLLTGQYLDFLSLTGIRDPSNRHTLYLSIFGITDFVRCTSLFNEPGTYCSSIAVLIATAINCNVISLKKNKILIASALLSMILSFSGFGVVLVSLILLGLYIDSIWTAGRKFKFKPIYLSFGLILITLSAILATSYFDSRLQENGAQKSGVLFRVILIDKFISSSMKEKMLGRDFEQREISISDYEDYLTYPEDLGLWFFWLYWYGLFFLIWFIITLTKFLKVPLAWAAVMLLSKVTGFSYLLVFVCLWNIKNRRFNES